jgi:predicted TIM-barrel fold metal-dependent hydrolase
VAKPYFDKMLSIDHITASIENKKKIYQENARKLLRLD